MIMLRPKDIIQKLGQSIKKVKFLPRLRRALASAGEQVIYAVLLLYYAYHGPDTPTWAKRTILGGIAYALAPLDLVPDLTPILGFTDDMGVLMFGLVSIAGHISDEIRKQARHQLTLWYGSVDEEVLSAIDKKL